MVSNVSIEEFRDIYPFKSRFIKIGSYNYHYLDEGFGETLLMLHGNPTWSFYYRNLIKGLRHNYRCIVPDHMGCGLSDKPQEYNYTLSKHIENLTELVNDLKLKDITLIMHDWGGAIGMGYAVRFPQQIKRLVLFNTAAFLSDQLPFSLKLGRHPQIGPMAILKFNAFARGALAWACKKKERVVGKVGRGYLAPYNSPENRIATLRFVQDIPVGPEVPSYPVIQSIESKLATFQNLPVSIIWGKKDFVFTDHFLKRWEQIFPNAEVHEIEKAGHYVVEDADEMIIPWLLQFFKSHPIIDPKN